MYKNDALVRPRYAETDQMGVIYHGNYYAWFEVGRSDFLGHWVTLINAWKRRGLYFLL